MNSALAHPLAVGVRGVLVGLLQDVDGRSAIEREEALLVGAGHEEGLPDGVAALCDADVDLEIAVHQQADDPGGVNLVVEEETVLTGLAKAARQATDDLTGGPGGVEPATISASRGRTDRAKAGSSGHRRRGRRRTPASASASGPSGRAGCASGLRTRPAYSGTSAGREVEPADLDVRQDGRR
jgi:hypothetical protein